MQLGDLFPEQELHSQLFDLLNRFFVSAEFITSVNDGDLGRRREGSMPNQRLNPRPQQLKTFFPASAALSCTP
ncbi:MAG: hypothetical protein R2688_04765 [Fimbriimonadaceae bacterium]